MSFEEVYDQVKNLRGWMGQQDCRVLYDYVSQLTNALIVEIGSFMGISTKVMALSSPSSQVIAIDPYLTVHPSSGLSDPETVFQGFKEATKGLNIRLIRDLSQNVGQTWNRPIDFLHVDGDHHYEFVKKDIDLFVPHVKPGGCIFFHDYVVTGLPGEYGIVEAIEENRDKYFSQVKTVSGFAVCTKK